MIPRRNIPLPEPSPSSAPQRLRFWHAIRRLTRRHWLYLPRLFSRRERLTLSAVGGIALISLVLFLGQTIGRVTIERPAVGGVLREGAVGEPRFINPVYASGDTERGLSNLVYAGLVRYDENGAPAMDLADAIEISPDGKSYTVRLRAGLRWHDGRPLTAADVAFTIRIIQDPEYRSPLRPNWQGVAVEKLDDASVRFSLRQAYAPFVENLALGILPEHLWRNIPRETAAISDLNLKPVGSGPYQFKKFTRREDGTVTSLTLARNRRYHREGPHLKEIRFTFYPGETELVTAYRRNEIDAFVFNSAAIRSELAGIDAEIHELRLPKIFGVFMNATIQPALGRKAVRQAMRAAIDRERLIEEAGGGAGVAAPTAIPPGTFGFNPNIAPPPYDPDAARKFLADDGWKDGDGVLERTEGSGARRRTTALKLRIATSDAPELAAAARLIAEMWKAIGVGVEITVLPITDLEATVLRPRAYEVLVFGEVFGRDPDPLAFWHTSQLKDPGLNIALYSNRAVDQLLEEARKTRDPAAREQQYRQFQKIVNDEIGAIFLYRPTNYYAIRRGFAGVNLAAAALPAERFNNLDQWHADTRRAFK